jgi:glycosyltransferase A (GT-A) superfamily protein (DUF2064 family)
MSTVSSSTAILLFARSAHEEVREKHFFPRAGYYRQLKLASQLNQNARRVAARTPFPLFIIAGASQRGHTFAERFTNAIQDVFDQGFRNVISIGNDCLDLNEQHIIQAANELERHNLVLGPTVDGGAYLIGISRDFFQKQIFAVLPWQQKELLSAFQSWANSTGNSIGLLQEEIDIDDPSSFKRAVFQLSKSLRIHWLRLVGCLCDNHYERYITYYFSNSITTLFLRGPPALATI